MSENWEARALAAEAEVERLRRDAGIDARGTTRAERLGGLVHSYRGELSRCEDRLERMTRIARIRG